MRRIAALVFLLVLLLPGCYAKERMRQACLHSKTRTQEIARLYGITAFLERKSDDMECRGRGYGYMLWDRLEHDTWNECLRRSAALVRLIRSPEIAALAAFMPVCRKTSLNSMLSDIARIDAVLKRLGGGGEEP
jgi:hypothetical protein